MSVLVDEQTDPRLVEAVRRIAQVCEPDFIFLFGSRARGDATDDSDYDLLVVVPASNLSAHMHAKRAYGELWGLGLPVEIVVFTKEQFDRQVSVIASLAATVRREGRLLYESE